MTTLNLHPPDETGRLAGIAWCLWRPPGQGPWPGVMVMHGAGSRKENHADFARLAAGNGFVALTFDNRGHGETEGELDPTVVDDLRLLAEWFAARPYVDERRVAARGSSMGGLMAIHAGAASDRIAAVVAICPAAEWMLAGDVRRIADGQPPREGSALAEMRIDASALAGWLESSDVGEAVQRMGATPLLIIHARGDEVVPYSHSEQLFELAAEPKKLLLLEGGDHRSAQHDAELQGESLRWLSRVM
jgi:alpha-beta hydrolase superfamily lysophospholipase